MNDHDKQPVKQQQSKNQSTKGNSHHGAWEDEMKSIMFQLQSQVKQLQEQHTTSVTHMQGLGYNYNKISDTLFGLKDSLALQDQLMKQLVQATTTTTQGLKKMRECFVYMRNNRRFIYYNIRCKDKHNCTATAMGAFLQSNCTSNTTPCGANHPTCRITTI